MEREGRPLSNHLAGGERAGGRLVSRVLFLLAPSFLAPRRAIEGGRSSSSYHCSLCRRVKLQLFELAPFSASRPVHLHASLSLPSSSPTPFHILSQSRELTQPPLCFLSPPSSQSHPSIRLPLRPSRSSSNQLSCRIKLKLVPSFPLAIQLVQRHPHRFQPVR